MTVYTGPERRSGKDRRDTIPFSKQLFYKGMREFSRRAEDRLHIKAFDRYPRPMMISIILVLSLSMLDALLTLILIAQGATEINPIMDYYLSHGPLAFLLAKYSLTVLPVIIIIIAKEPIAFRYRISGKLLNVFAVFFGAVVIWECYLLSVH